MTLQQNLLLDEYKATLNNYITIVSTACMVHGLCGVVSLGLPVWILVLIARLKSTSLILRWIFTFADIYLISFR